MLNEVLFNNLKLKKTKMMQNRHLLNTYINYGNWQKPCAYIYVYISKNNYSMEEIIPRY